MSLKFYFQQMKEILSTKDKWTRHYYAKDINGNTTALKSEAVCFCLVGASLVLTSRTDDIRLIDLRSESEDILNHMRSKLPPGYKVVSSFNDNPKTSFEDIHKFLDNCIETSPN